MKLPHERLIDRKERRELIPYSETHYSRLEKQGRVPARISIGDSRVAWSLTECLEWVEQKKAERDLQKAVRETAIEQKKGERDLQETVEA